MYHAAALGVVLDPQTNTQRFFTQHTDDITAMDLSDDGKTVVTGEIGPRPKICLWSGETQELIAMVNKPLQKGICALAFSPDGQKFAAIAVDVDHQVAVFNLTGQVLFFCEKNAYEQVEICWGSNTEFMSCGPKANLLWKLNETTFSPRVQAGNNKTSNKCATIGASKGKYLSGASDGTVNGSVVHS